MSVDASRRVNTSLARYPPGPVARWVSPRNSNRLAVDASESQVSLRWAFDAVSRRLDILEGAEAFIPPSRLRRTPPFPRLSPTPRFLCEMGLGLTQGFSVAKWAFPHSTLSRTLVWSMLLVSHRSRSGV